MSLIHRYQSNGYNIVLDINSGCIHLVDEVTYEVLPYLEEGMEADAIANKFGDRFKKEDVETSVTECKKLKEQGMLFTKDIYENIIDEFTKNRQTVVKALCLHIAHDCNLACRYCFAEEGEYHGRRALMWKEGTGFPDRQFRFQKESGSGFLWWRAAYELAGCKGSCEIWKRAGEAS